MNKLVINKIQHKIQMKISQMSKKLNTRIYLQFNQLYYRLKKEILEELECKILINQFASQKARKIYFK